MDPHEQYASEFAELLDVLRSLGLTISDRVEMMRDLIIAVEANEPARATGRGRRTDFDDDDGNGPPPLRDGGEIYSAARFPAERRRRPGPNGQQRAADFVCSFIPDGPRTPPRKKS